MYKWCGTSTFPRVQSSYEAFDTVFPLVHRLDDRLTGNKGLGRRGGRTISNAVLSSSKSLSFHLIQWDLNIWKLLHIHV